MKNKIIIISIIAIVVLGTIFITGAISYNDSMEMEFDRIPVPIEKIPEIRIGMTRKEIDELFGSTGYSFESKKTYIIDIGDRTIEEAIQFLLDNTELLISVPSEERDESYIGHPLISTADPELYKDGMFIYFRMIQNGDTRKEDDCVLQFGISCIDYEKESFLENERIQKFEIVK